MFCFLRHDIFLQFDDKRMYPQARPSRNCLCQQKKKKKKVKEGGERKGGKGKLSVQLKSERKILVNEAKLNKLLKILL